MRTGIVLEGGGMRGVYTAGVLEAFMEQGFLADELVGVSAGASNGVSYVAGQKGRCLRTNLDYAGDKRYAGLSSWRKTGSFFGMDFIFGEIPDRLDPFDWQAFYSSRCGYEAGVTDLASGKAVFFGKESLAPGCELLRASCSMPLFSPVVHWNGRDYLDGGVAAPIPARRALELGCERLVVVLTRPRGYRKPPQKGMAALARYYRQYPALVAAMGVRHQVYNEQLDFVARLEDEGKAVVVAPAAALELGRFEQSREKLAAAGRQGFADGLAALEKL